MALISSWVIFLHFIRSSRRIICTTENQITIFHSDKIWIVMIFSYDKINWRRTEKRNHFESDKWKICREFVNLFLWIHLAASIRNKINLFLLKQKSLLFSSLDLVILSISVYFYDTLIKWFIATHMEFWRVSARAHRFNEMNISITHVFTILFLLLFFCVTDSSATTFSFHFSHLKTRPNIRNELVIDMTFLIE